MKKQDIYELATVIRWTPPGRYPENARYVLIRYYDEELEERTFGFGSFEMGCILWLDLTENGRICPQRM